jgi:hypothetical protein
MNAVACDRCGQPVAANTIERTLVRAYCKSCLVAEQADSEKLEKALLRSIGTRKLLIGLFMIAIGIAILTLGLAGGSAVIAVPTGLLLGGLYEVVAGVSKL